MRRDRSELVICSWGKRYGLPLCSLVWEGSAYVPKILSSSANAASVQITNRPTCPPGASCSRESEATSA